MKALIREVVDSFEQMRPEHAAARRLALRQRDRLVPVEPAWEHLDRAIAWLCRAQDAVPAGGVSWGYAARVPFKSKLPVGWRAAYPETTGYIIETMDRYGIRTGNAECRARARRMADWELAIQLPDGGTQGGRIGATPVASSTFVTGQVLFGWLYAHQNFGGPRYLEAARRAGDFLLSCLDGEGRFVRGHSHFCEPGPKAYEARTGWALAELGRATGDPRYSDAARAMSRFALSCRLSNCWFAQNDLDTHETPLTHTIGYVLEGMLETGWLLNEPQFEEAVAGTLRALVPLVRADGFLAGRWNRDWTPVVDWACLTGSSQIALVALRLHARRPDKALFDMAARLLGFVSATQLASGFQPGLLGGIHGSYPFDGAYCRHALPNWASKFYADAMLLYLS